MRRAAVVASFVVAGLACSRFEGTGDDPAPPADGGNEAQRDEASADAPSPDAPPADAGRLAVDGALVADDFENSVASCAGWQPTNGATALVASTAYHGEHACLLCGDGPSEYVRKDVAVGPGILTLTAWVRHPDDAGPKHFLSSVTINADGGAVSSGTNSRDTTTTWQVVQSTASSDGGGGAVLLLFADQSGCVLVDDVVLTLE